MEKLYLDTTRIILLSTLRYLMSIPEFKVFRLVGGTALSLQRGHRISVDIDLFTDADYRSWIFQVWKKYCYVITPMSIG